MTPRRRIVCALQLPPPLHGVTAINAQIVASEGLAERFELDVVPMQFSETVAELGTISLGKLVEAAAVGVRIAAKLATRPDAFYITMAVQRPACFRDAGYLALAATLGVPRIVHLHARPEKAVLPLLRQALRGATVILLSPALRADLGDAVTDAQLRYVPNGIPDPGAPPTDAPRGARVLFLSNLLPEKGPLVLVDALAQLVGRGVDFEATFAGAPSREIGAAKLGDAIQRAGIAERARHVGAVDEAGKDVLFRAHDVFVLPSAREAFPLVVLEAMAAGLPVVATRVGALADLVDDGGSGILVDRSAGGSDRASDRPAQRATDREVDRRIADDRAGPRAADRPAQRADREAEVRTAAGIADALERLLGDHELRERMGRAGRARFLERFTAARFERQLGDVLAEVAGA